MSQSRTKAKKSNKTHILARYGVITLLFVLLSAGIVVKLFKTTVVEAAAWNERAAKDFSRLEVIAPERGKILSDNGNILACNLQVFDIKIDLRHAKVSQLEKSKGLPWNSLDSLADSLDLYYPARPDLAGKIDKDSEYSWHQKLKKAFSKTPDKRSRAFRLVKKGTRQDFEYLRTLPFLNRFTGNGYRNPLYVEAKNVRIYPYGRMAYRSIGRVNERDNEFHGYSGLEMDLDSLLYGQSGLAKKVTMTNGIANWVESPPVNGYDIQTTINIDLQDMLEEELTSVCEGAHALWGTALLMEVATGEIKAIANVQLLEDGTYGEALNRAVRGFEPGSVMKPISLMIAFEDGLVKSVNDVVDCSPFQRTSDPHAPTVKTMKQVIEMSSNTGISRIIFRGYANDPTKFHQRLEKIGFFEPMKTGICGAEVPYFPLLLPQDSKGNNITMTARHLSLARQAYGYASTIPPLYTLAYYNAIANGGLMVKPHLMKRITSEMGDSVIDIKKLERRVCSPETAEKVKQCLHEPVWGPHGTAKLVQDDRVEIAGKTGTAYPVPEKGGTYDTSKRRYAFAGFFPYDSPKYSCISLILAGSGTSANRTSGQVVKNMAVKMYARGLLDNISTYTAEKTTSTPLIIKSVKTTTAAVANLLKASKIKTFNHSKNADSTTQTSGSIPDLTGYDAVSAVKILEEMGWNASISGAGYVCSQTPAAGSRLPRGGKVNLSLRI